MTIMATETIPASRMTVIRAAARIDSSCTYYAGVILHALPHIGKSRRCKVDPVEIRKEATTLVSRRPG
jgi:hypothetical protein